VDAVPGRLNQVVTAPCNYGTFYGQCSELCGVAHGFMPIKVKVIPLSDFNIIVKNKFIEYCTKILLNDFLIYFNKKKDVK